MEKLCYKTLKDQGYDGYLLEDAPVRVLQFGEGNFLRAFVDYFIDMMNEKAGFNGKVVLTQPIAQGLAPMINEQEGLYTLFLRGRENGEKVNRKRVISCVKSCNNPYDDFEGLMDNAKNPELRFIISNTTEAGIQFDPSCKADDAPPSSFPGKLTVFLYERFKLGLKGFVVLSCELIDHNGDELKRCVKEYIKLWNLGADFEKWVDEENIFCSTLVDRIVTGYPRDEAAAICEELGYQDNIIDTAEVFGFWVIEGPQSIKDEFPVDKAGLPILVVDDHMPYKERKVRILNGAHTSMVLAANLAGKSIVLECMEDDVIRNYMNETIFDEIIPTLELPKDELVEFADSVIDRFNNPYIDHRLTDIALNSTAKWKARVMPTVQRYVKKTGELPAKLVFSFAAYIAYYRAGGEFVRDDQWVLDFYDAHRGDDNKTLVHAVVNNDEMWGGELAAIPRFEEAVVTYLDKIDSVGMYEAMKELNK